MRQFILQKNLEKDGTVTLEGKDYKYLRQVLRLRPGDMLSLRLKDGSLRNSTVTKIDEKSHKVYLQICAGEQEAACGRKGTFDSAKTVTRGVQAQQIQSEADSNSKKIEYALIQFLPRPQKFEQIVRQAVECGIKYIIPVAGEFSEKSSILALSGNKKERLERIVKEARQQSGSPVDTQILEPMSLADARLFVEKWSGMEEATCATTENLITAENSITVGNSITAENRIIDKSASPVNQNPFCNPSFAGFVLSERDENSVTILEILAQKPSIKKIAIVCGSEGGISPQELSFLCEKTLFYPVHFSVNILRCETAALYGIAAVQTAV